ncbi:MAG: hypothetical protein JXA30_22785 [Deltaproteobacteria bacterium]|nr:hypothetical protein [Deltaproteobacteria bacterium]
MMDRSRQGNSFRVEDFVESLTSQLDRAQDALAYKARAGRPLTFALKDLDVDLKVFWESDREGKLALRHAGPNEEGASTVKFSFTTITRSMAEENAIPLGVDEDPRDLSVLKSEEGLSDEDIQKLNRVGVQTVGQFKRVSRSTHPNEFENHFGIPVNNLREALERSSRPTVTGHNTIVKNGRRMLRIYGANLRNGVIPEVQIAGEPIEVLEASKTELLVRPLAHHTEGRFDIFVDGERASGFFSAPPERPQADASPAPSDAAEPRYKGASKRKEPYDE